MNRRFLISALAALPFANSARAATPWSAQFLAGSFDGKAYSAGLYVRLDKGWKTYWRNPGDAGIPPSITAAPNDNLVNMTIDFPLPLRIKDESGEAFGYRDEVLFPLTITPKDMGLPLSVHFSSFFGVCQQICTPAKFEATLNFSPKSAPTTDAAIIAKWRSLVPKTGPIAKVAIVRDKFLRLDLMDQFSDIFIEGPERYYFGQPEFAQAGMNASFKIAGLKNDGDLKGVELRITANANGRGLEQRITVA